MKSRVDRNAGAAVKQKDIASTWKEIKKNKASYLLMTPYMLFFLIFMVVPVLAAIVLSFTSFNMLQAPRFINILNYERLFLEDKIFIKVLKNTLLFALFTGPIGYILSFMLAWLINELGHRMRMFMTFLFYAPALLTNLYFMWAFMFSGDANGVVNGTLISMGFIQEPIQWFSNAKTVVPVLIIIQLWASMGTAFLAFIAGFQSQDRSLFEAGSIDGIKNRWQELWYISIPQMAPQLLFGAVMQISASFSVSTVVTSLAGWPTTEYAADTIVTYMTDIGNVRFEMGYASAIAVFLFTLMLLVNQVIKSALKNFSMD